MYLNGKQKAAFGIGAVGKDMVYALSASYVMYYYQDLLGLPAAFVGTILMIARIFDAFNDPFMGVLVAKTKSRWGRFRPWLLSGTVLNAFVTYLMFKAPQLEQGGLMVFFTIIYILWGMTYTMMDIPYWSMIPAVTDTPKDRENLSVIGRTCAGVGSALVQVGTLMLVGFFGGGNERQGFAMVALVISIIFIIAEIICCLFVKERQQTRMETVSVGEMFRSLFRNDQAMITVLAILMINSALYITSNLVIYFFKYDMGGAGWVGNYTLFTTLGGGTQILGMMVVYPLLRKKLSNTRIFNVALCMSILGYALLLLICFTGLGGSLPAICVPGVLIFAANGILSVLTTVFLSGTADYAELKTGHREESVIFSMQTFVVKAASGLAVFITGLGLDLIGLVGNTEETGEIVQQAASTILGLRLLMTIIPIVLLAVALFFFNRKFILTDERAAQIAQELQARRAEQAQK